MSISHKIRELRRLAAASPLSRDNAVDGFALGLFTACLPLIGLQTVIAILLAALFRRSKVMALLAVWVANPFSLSPVFIFNYWLGTFFWPGHMALDEFRVLFSQGGFTEWLGLSRDLLVPLTLGSLATGASVAAVCRVLGRRYFDVLWQRLIIGRTNGG